MHEGDDSSTDSDFTEGDTEMIASFWKRTRKGKMAHHDRACDTISDSNSLKGETIEDLLEGFVDSFLENTFEQAENNNVLSPMDPYGHNSPQSELILPSNLDQFTFFDDTIHDDTGINVATYMPTVNSPSNSIDTHNSENSFPQMPALQLENNPNIGDGTAISSFVDENRNNKVQATTAIKVLERTRPRAREHADEGMETAGEESHNSGDTVSIAQIKSAAMRRWLEVSRISMKHAKIHNNLSLTLFIIAF